MVKSLYAILLPLPLLAQTPIPQPQVPADVTAELRTALRQMTGLQEREWALNGGYSKTLGYSEHGIELSILWAGQSGWSAVARDLDHPRHSCVMFIGWIPATAWPRTAQEGLTGEVGGVRCDGDTRAPTMTWDEYVDYRVRRVIDRIARGQHKSLDRDGTFSTAGDSLVGQSDPEVHVTIAWATKTSWGARAWFTGTPTLSCVLWEGSDAPRDAAARLRVPALRGPGVAVCAGP